MGMLQRFENRLEQAVSGAFAKAFRSAVQPVELAAALQREVDNSAQILSRNRRLVPNSFEIELSPTDHDRLSPYSHTLRQELVDMLREHADDQRYVFAGPVTIDFSSAEDLVTGRFRVRSHAAALVEAPAPPIGRPRRSSVALEVNGATHPLVAPGMVVGRGADADLRINDPGVSRRHARLWVNDSRSPDGRGLEGRGVPVVQVADLGSTNGTFVDGRRVSEAELRAGSTVRVGNTELVVRFTEAG
jgi:Protein of unknown function (DUF3662)/FHA domain